MGGFLLSRFSRPRVRREVPKIGWWQIQRGKTLTAWDGDLRSIDRYAYFYAQAAQGGVLAGTGASLAISAHPFNQPALDASDGHEQAGFIELDFADNYGLGVILGPGHGQYPLVPQPFPGCSDTDGADTWALVAATNCDKTEV